MKQVGYYIAVFAVSNFTGALILGPLLDTIGRVKMLTSTYVISGTLLGITGLTLDSSTTVTLTLMGCIIFFFASAGASAAYLTASEVFPDGDPGAVPRLLLRRRHRRRRYRGNRCSSAS